MTLKLDKENHLTPNSLVELINQIEILTPFISTILTHSGASDIGKLENELIKMLDLHKKITFFTYIELTGKKPSHQLDLLPFVNASISISVSILNELWSKKRTQEVEIKGVYTLIKTICNEVKKENNWLINENEAEEINETFNTLPYLVKSNIEYSGAISKILMSALDFYTYRNRNETKNSKLEDYIQILTSLFKDHVKKLNNTLCKTYDIDDRDDIFFLLKKNISSMTLIYIGLLKSEFIDLKYNLENNSLDVEHHINSALFQRVENKANKIIDLLYPDIDIHSESNNSL